MYNCLNIAVKGWVITPRTSLVSRVLNYNGNKNGNVHGTKLKVDCLCAFLFWDRK